jgi:putative resolvase
MEPALSTDDELEYLGLETVTNTYPYLLQSALMEKRLVKIGDAAQLLGVGISTLRKWAQTGELIPARKTKGGTRYFDVNALMGLGDADAPTIGYARVSSPDQRAD